MTFEKPEASRVKARRLLWDLLRIEPNATQLLAVAGEVLGSDRVSRSVERVREAPLSRRAREFSHLAGIVAGVKTLGPRWWRQPHRRFDKPGEWDDGPPPEDVLAVPLKGRNATALGLLWEWISDDVADALWGPPVDTVDLNSQKTSNRIDLPADARAGDRLVASFDPGSRVDGDIVEVDGVLGSVLDLDSCRHSPPSEASWAWEIGAGPGPHRLADESGSNDPYGTQVDEAAAKELRTWAIRHGMDESDVGASWARASDVVDAVRVADVAYRPSGWLFWERAAWALVDGARSDFEMALALITTSMP